MNPKTKGLIYIIENPSAEIFPFAKLHDAHVKAYFKKIEKELEKLFYQK
jgi:hypothetical protein